LAENQNLDIFESYYWFVIMTNKSQTSNIVR